MKNKKKNALSRHQQRLGKLRPKDEAFCRAVALEGVSASQAYRDHIATSQLPNTSAWSLASKMMGNPLIRDRVEALRERDKRRIEERLNFTRDTLAKFYIDALTTPVGEVDQNNPLCQEYTVTAGEEFSQTKVKMVGKMDAAKELAKMAGWVGGGGGDSKVPQVVINLGAVFSPSPDSPPLTAVRIVDSDRNTKGDDTPKRLS